MYSPGGGPKVLLKRLREIMAGTEEAQDRLNMVTRLIASNMVAEVCSIYLSRAGQTLELFASQGLKAGAIHRTRLRIGEGLVGEIAARGAPLRFSNAPENPGFVYRPETGEEIYKSLMGVPILRGGRVVGVLVVQNKAQRRYDDDEVDALQTVAMVLAEMIGGAAMVDPEELHEGSFERGVPPVLDGLTLSGGIAEGIAVLHEPRVDVSHLIAEDEDSEKQRLEEALDGLRLQLDSMINSLDLGLAGEHREVLETFRMFADDRGWRAKIVEAIGTGLSAEAAVQRVQMDTRARMESIKDPYIRERMSDLDDLAQRLVRRLAGLPDPASIELPERAILVARNLGPAELLDYDPARIAGVVLSEGSLTSHVTIIARTLGVPMIGQVEGVVGQVESGDHLILDGAQGRLHVRPTPDIIVAFKRAIADRNREVDRYTALIDEPSVTRDGTRVELCINAGLLIDMAQLKNTGAAGIGLFRTEFQFMISDTFPRLGAQVELYKTVLDAAEDKPVVFRTLDIGGDKLVPFMSWMREENPALGWRAIRLALDRPALLRYQVRAMLQAAVGRELRLMFPLVADVAEFRAARAMVDVECARLERLQRPGPSAIHVGSMIEVPSLAWQLDSLMRHADFVSIGSNDLIQFLFACDRGNPRLAQRYDWLSPSVLAFIRQVVVAGEKAGVAVGLCGEMASRPLEAMALIGLGLRSLSMPPASVGPVKEMLRSVDLATLSGYVQGLTGHADHSVRGHLQNFARDHDIVVNI